MRVPTSSSTGKSAPIRRKKVGTTESTSTATATSSIHNIQDESLILGIPPEEMTQKVRMAIMTLMSEVDDMRKELEFAHRKISELEKLADQDGMLEISNRRAFVREMTRMISYSQRYGINSSMIYIDLNDLKKINDTFGHKAGDAALKKVTTIIINNLRDSDIIGRLGGDEFGIILPKANETDANLKAKSLIEAIKQNPLEWQDQEIKLDAAYGIHPIMGHESADQALDQADKNMYINKKELKKT